ncbi:MAG: transporter substrate-binding domain-containing protein, partial [Deltaproteobacteria bacterium]|nr:transporter substrate-binding domain-containing protein [Deltaproteobacteria bacterium]
PMQNNRFAPINFLVIQFSILFLTTLMPHQSLGAGWLRVGVSLNNPPFSYVENDETDPKGFSVDLANLLAENMDMTAQLYPMDEQNLRKALIDGNIDLVIGMRDATYSTPDIYQIETTVKGIETKIFINSNYPPIKSYRDLAGCKVAIEKGYNIPSFLPSEQMEMNSSEANSMYEALALVDSGNADIYISKNLLATRQTIQKNHFQNIKEIGEPISISPLIIAVKKMNTELLTSISMAYGQSLENRSYFTIYDKWLRNNFQSYMDRYKKFIFAGVGAFILALLSFILWNRTLQSKVISITRDLRNSEKKYRDLIETSPDMICLVSMYGKIKLANKIALTHLGYDQKEIADLRLHNLVVPEQADDVSNFINDVFRGVYSNKEFTFLTKDGRNIQVDMVANVVKEAEPAEKFVCCFSRDITERKRLEEDLLYADRLAIMGRMAAGIAHEINNPLGIILGNAQDALYHKLSVEDSLESLKCIERNAIRAAKIIEDMLNFTRPVPLQLCPVDLPLQVDSTLFLLKQKLKQKDIRIKKSYPSEPAVFKGDENLIQQLLINIILNSIQAIKNEGLINIAIRKTGDNGNTKVTLEINDNGVGIPDEDIQNVFNPFFTSRKENGFGMGLFISKIIVEKHHGSISAKSAVGEGTVMTVEFPVETTGAAVNEYGH